MGRVKLIFKWLALAAAGLLGLAAIAVAAVYVMIGNDLAATYEIDWVPAKLSIEQVDLDEARRMVQTRGCFGCHDPSLTGQDFSDIFADLPDGTHLAAPNLRSAAKQYSVAELDDIIRHGVRPDGSGVFMLMPTTMYQFLSDKDAALIIAYLKSLPAEEKYWPDTYFGPLTRIMLFAQKRSAGYLLAADEVDHVAVGRDSTLTDSNSKGRYIAMTACSECHGPDLAGINEVGFYTPPLTIVQAYSPQDFANLMRTGIAIGDRHLGLMTMVAVDRFSHFTDEEVTQLHDYLKSLTVPDR